MLERCNNKGIECLHEDKKDITLAEIIGVQEPFFCALYPSS